MATRFITLPVLTLLSCFACAQTPDFNWAFRFGSFMDDGVRSIVTDADGNVYATGHFRGTVDFDPGSGAHNLVSAGIDIFVSKYNVSGDLVWAHKFGVTGSNAGEYILWDGSFLYIAGMFADTVDFDPGSGTHNLMAVNGTMFIAKYDTALNLIWAGNIDASHTLDGTTSIDTDSSGNFYITGIFQQTADLDPGPAVMNFTSAGGFDLFICKLDPSGNLVWAKHFPGQLSAFANAIAVDAAGNSCITGGLEGTMDCDPDTGTYNLSSLGFFDIFVIKIDNNGNLLWAKLFGGSEDFTVGYTLALDDSGNIYSSGKFRGDVDFDPDSGVTMITATAIDAYLIKLDMTGALQSVSAFLGDWDASAYTLQLDSLNSVYVGGHFSGTVDFDPGFAVLNVSSAGYADAFLIRLDPAMNLDWVIQYGGADDDLMRSMVLNDQGSVFCAGRFIGNCDFDPGAAAVILSSAGNFDGYILGLTESSSTSVPHGQLSLPELTAYPNPASGNLMIKIPEGTEGTLELAGSGGELVLRKILPPAAEEINVRELAPGIYFLKLTTDNYSLTKKVIVCR